jgi:hypothetical protein
VAELKEVAVIKEPELEGVGLDERPDRAALERGDPGHAVERLELADGLVRDHAAIADQHDPDRTRPQRRNRQGAQAGR